MNNLINNPGFSHITKKILNILDNKDQLLCRSGIWLVVSIFKYEKTIFHISFFAVCQSLKTHVDQPIFWIQKLDHEGQSDNLHDAWIDLVQRIEKGSFLEQQLVKCLMKWYTKKNNLTYWSFSGVLSCGQDVIIMIFRRIL